MVNLVIVCLLPFAISFTHITSGNLEFLRARKLWLTHRATFVYYLR